ncbi:uncharacterized protein LOC125369937 [Ricinus communis]|uniref:uncharacterized protein LOC125369937 n=1 Tax=Ricinus communis TaxID=3988 RepID=UPI00201A8717|nr:uncharacterized protein LOC125369937 [Ricinus communis]
MAEKEALKLLIILSPEPSIMVTGNAMNDAGEAAVFFPIFCHLLSPPTAATGTIELVVDSWYVKFLKEILSNKRKFEDLAFVMLNEECSAIFQNKLSKKKYDRGSFTIPCIIGDLTISDALAYLRASINVLSYNLFAKLGLAEIKPTRMSIQLVDRSVKYPRGVVENVLVKVDKFIFPIDFVILDMDGESSVILIPGRPFLATSRAIINVCHGKLELRVEDETVTFDLNNVVYSINILDDVVETQL